ncbi:MAG: sufurtransferase FdhD [Candidatus Handelsmanbacteria bacterium RIFCSPLOWO2_12_FULL_64_10]|uniref:Sulfur carrier protein FdhD n=1 Tax=Handelsmanbacteria sp. (strain RIFCSPLOWO2_12_FULL_64_10) TaxID=1817868 RepID=A0A1F6C7V1_HANXR|nr:MAG: sufurtransferase FdhD [Candidatus Handelsmanbacteria bacterium RIFCSPLOWO2_12_FULL_64_10]
MSTSAIVSHLTTRLRGSAAAPADDLLAVEEPLEVRLQGQPIAVIMRTPGDDFELAAGFLHTEGILRTPRDIGAISYCKDAEPPNLENVLDVVLSDGVPFDLERLRRNVYASSSCGICGKATIEAIHAHAPPVAADFTLPPGLLYALPDRLRAAQSAFDRTGGLHAAGLFDLDGNLIVLREDVGRHNAVDKIVGHLLLRDLLPADRRVLMVSGRAGFEIVQKALVARIPVVAAVSAPSSLAVDLAVGSNMTLVGFLRGDRLNVYAGGHRLGIASS